MRTILSALENTLVEPDMEILYKNKYNTKGDMVYEETEEVNLFEEKTELNDRNRLGCFATSKD